MSYHYNEAFENPDYHFSETLEIDRRGSSQRNPFSHQTPYDSSQYDHYGEHRGREQNHPVAIPMASLGPGSDYSQDLPSTSPYGNFTDNPSFEPEPELTYTQHSTSHTLDDPYAHGIASGSEDSFIRRRSRRPPDEIFMTSSSMLETDPAFREEEDLVGSLASMSSKERIKAIQKMPKTMRKKREIRNKVLKEINKKSRHRGAQCIECLQGAAVSFRRFGNTLSEYFQQLRPWHKTLKIIGDEFGTSVLSYFVFLKWLLNFNIFSFLVNCGFITIPQFLAAEPNNLSFTGLELLSGAGYFQQTVLYYGFYTNATISKVENGTSYNMQLAYIFTVGMYFVICFFILLFSMARYFSRNFVNSQAYSGNASKLLCTWDFNITNEKAVKLQQKNLLTEIKEGFTEVNKEVRNFSVKERVVNFATHLLAWVASLATAVAACAGVYFLSINNLELFMKGYSNDLQRQAAMLVLPVIVTLLSTLIPFFFSWLGHLEKFQTPGQHIYVTIIRNTILKMSIVGILCYYWLNIVATSESQCWETLVGQDIYRLVLIDFIFCLLGSFFGEFLQRIIGTTVCMSLGLPEFDIGRNVLDLIYAQTLTWIGILFSPLLPGIQMIALLIVFFVKKVSLMRNCQPPCKVWRTSQMMTSFIFLLFCPSFLGVLSVVGVAVWKLKPSEECGPFRGLPSMNAAIAEWIQILESSTAWKWVAWIYHNLISSELFFFIITSFVIVLTYLFWQIIQARKTMTNFLHNQIINAGKDKRFLLLKLRRVQWSKRNSSALGGRGQQHPFSVETSSSSDFPPGGEPSQTLAALLALLARAAALREDSDGSGGFQPRAGAGSDGSGGFQPRAGAGSDGIGGFQPRAGAGSDGSGGFQPWAGAGSDGSGGFQPWAGAGSDGTGGFQPWAGAGSDGTGGFQPRAGAGSDGTGEFQPRAGAGSDGIGGFQPWAGAGSDGTGGFQPRAGAGSDGIGGFQPRAGAGSDGIGGFQPRAGAGSDGTGGFQPRAGAGSDGIGGFQPRAGAGSDGIGGFQPWAGAGSDGTGGFQPRAGAGSDGTGGFQPRAGAGSDGTGGFQPRAGAGSTE